MTGASRPVPASDRSPDADPDSSWYSSSTFTDQMSWSETNRTYTASIAVYIEWPWLLYLCMPLRPIGWTFGVCWAIHAFRTSTLSA